MGLKEGTERYREFNDKLATRLQSLHTPIPPKPSSFLPHSLSCDSCGKRGPEGTTIAHAAMLAQKDGWVYSLAGRVKWSCAGCR